MASDASYTAAKEAIHEKLTSLFDGSIYMDFSKWMKVGPSAGDNSIYAIVWELAKNVFDVFLLAGCILSLCYFVMYIIDKVSKQEVTIDGMMRCCIELVIALIVMVNAWTISQKLLDLGDAMYDDTATAMSQAGEAGSGNVDFVEDMYKELTDDSDSFSLKPLRTLYLKISYSLNFGMIETAQKISAVMMIVAGITRGILVIILTMFFPIGIANLYGNGLNSPGMRYMKRYAAACISGAIMVAISTAAQFLQVAVLNTENISATTGPIYSLAVAFVAVAMMFKAPSFANDIVGV